MAEAKNGDSVQVHYTGKLQDGTVFDTSEGREPLQVQLGSGSVIRGFENAIIGMKEGESKTAHIPADQAYGPHQEEMMIVLPRDQFPPDFQPRAGQQVQIQTKNGETFMAAVGEITDGEIILDANHPLAGKDLTFDIKLVKID